MKFVLLLICLEHLSAFQHAFSFTTKRSILYVSADNEEKVGLKDNKAMAFLRKKGLVGGKTDFANVIGVDEGESGKYKQKVN